LQLDSEKKIRLDAVLAFEIAAYRAESELSAQRFRAEAQFHAIESSRTWRYTKPVRMFLNILVRPALKSKRGLKILILMNKFLP
jgi:hypothetical protein